MQNLHDEFADLDDALSRNERDFHSEIIQKIREAEKQGRVWKQDAKLLIELACNPGIGVEDLAHKLCMTPSNCYKRMNRPNVLELRAEIDEHMAQRMTAAMDLYSRWVHETLDLASRDPAIILKEALGQSASPEQATMLLKAHLRRTNPDTIVRLGHSLMAYASEQAKLQAAVNARAGLSAGSEPLQSTPEALAILEADVITSPLTPTLDVKPIGSPEEK